MAMIVARVVTPDAGSRTLAITWADGHESRIPYATLRDACPCARCRDGRERGRRELRMAHALQLLRWSRLGNYALHLEWGDSHGEGIYTYDHLRALCPCPGCAGS